MKCLCILLVNLSKGLYITFSLVPFSFVWSSRRLVTPGVENARPPRRPGPPGEGRQEHKGRRALPVSRVSGGLPCQVEQTRRLAGTSGPGPATRPEGRPERRASPASSPGRRRRRRHPGEGRTPQQSQLTTREGNTTFDLMKQPLCVCCPRPARAALNERKIVTLCRKKYGDLTWREGQAADRGSGAVKAHDYRREPDLTKQAFASPGPTE